MRIGVFDSGIGGQAVAESLKDSFKDAEINCVSDTKNVPYGNKTQAEIIKLTCKAVEPLVKNHYDVIVIACNTASTVALDYLRQEHPNQVFIGLDPMIKPAASITKTNNIAVCATPRTLSSERYNKLKEAWAKDINVIEPDCKSWAELIERGRSNEINLDAIIKDLIEQEVDVIVLGCTHYHLIKQVIIDRAGDNITVLEPSDSIAKRIKMLI